MATGKQINRQRPRPGARLKPAHAMAETAKLFRSATSSDDSPHSAQQLALATVLRAFDTNANRRTAIPSIPAGVKLSPRLQQTLDRLLLGDSEKQIAITLQLSKNTVHVYVKSLYKQFGVNSRGELLARFIHGPASIHR